LESEWGGQGLYYLSWSKNIESFDLLTYGEKVLGEGKEGGGRRRGEIAACGSGGRQGTGKRDQRVQERSSPPQEDVQKGKERPQKTLTPSLRTPSSP
jgi:hypothetical protein